MSAEIGDARALTERRRAQLKAALVGLTAEARSEVIGQFHRTCIHCDKVFDHVQEANNCERIHEGLPAL